MTLHHNAMTEVRTLIFARGHEGSRSFKKEKEQSREPSKILPFLL